MSYEKAASSGAEAARLMVEGLAALVGWLVDEDSAAQILGLPVGVVGEWIRGRADLPPWMGSGDQPRLICHARDLAEYAWNGTWHADATSLEEATAEFLVAAELLRGSPVSPQGGDLFPAGARETLERLTQAVLGRLALDDPDGQLTIEQLSALAGVAEKTIRMAANPNQAHPLRTQRVGHRTFVPARDALEWLSRRRDFQRTRLHASGPGQLPIVDAESLALVCQRWGERRGLSPESLAKKLSWTKRQKEAYQAIAEGAPDDVLAEFPPDGLYAIAVELGMPDAGAFAAQSYRVLALAHASVITRARLGDISPN